LLLCILSPPPLLFPEREDSYLRHIKEAIRNSSKIPCVFILVLVYNVLLYILKL
jgi:hypothetical protein